MPGVLQGQAFGVVAHERHVGHQHSPTIFPLHHGQVIDDVLHRHRQSRVVSLYDHPQRIADENDFHAAGAGDLGEGRVIRRYAGKFLALSLEFVEGTER